MKKRDISGYIILGILFALLNIIVFSIPTVKTQTFWVAYVFTVVAFALQIPVWNKVLGTQDTMRSKFLGIPVLHVSLVYFGLQIVALAVFMAVPTLPVWTAIVACSIILGLSLVCMISTNIGIEEINRVEEKVQAKTFYIRSLQMDVELLADAENDPEIKTALKLLAEKIRFSDPMSSSELGSIEFEITNKIVELKTASDKKTIIADIGLLLTERNKKAKILK